MSLGISLSVTLGGCATNLLEKQMGNTPIKTSNSISQKVFSDEIISYGIPASPIEQHEYAIAMAGNKYSYLIEPTAELKKTLFQDFLNKVDTQYLAFTSPYQSKDDLIQANSIQQLNFEILGENIYQTLMFMFIKPITQIKKSEIETMQGLQFQCAIKTNLTNQKDYLVCKQNVSIKLTVATKAQNTDILTHKFRSPLTFDFYQNSEKTKINLKRMLLTPFYMLTITYDILSLPVIAGLSYIGIDEPADKAFEGFFKF